MSVHSLLPLSSSCWRTEGIGLRCDSEGRPRVASSNSRLCFRKFIYVCTLEPVLESCNSFLQLDLSPYYVKAAKENMDYFYGELHALHVPLGRGSEGN
jgi:hypothetical protein